MHVNHLQSFRDEMQQGGKVCSGQPGDGFDQQLAQRLDAYLLRINCIYPQQGEIG